MKIKFFLLPMLLAFFSCDPQAGDVAHQTVPYINGGYSEPGQPGVVLISHDYGYMCTGTLIAPKIVVTAKHCVRDLDTGSNFPVSGFRVYVGPTMWNTVFNTRVSAVRTYPGTAIEDEDIALLTLSNEITADIATPYGYVVATTGDSSLVIDQTQLTIIGYGESICGQTNNAGVKLRTEDTFIGYATAGGDFITQGRGANHGDSGGPIFTAQMKLIGVTSRGADECTGELAGLTIGALVPKHLDMIREVMEAAGYCAPVANEDECGNGIDDDCNGYIDDACSEPGDLCINDWECSNGMCLTQGGEKRCMKSCDPRQTTNACGAGNYCRVVACDSAVCSPGVPGLKGSGDACSFDTECESTFCRTAADGVKRCLTPCAPGHDECLADEACVTAPEACGACNPEYMALATGRNLGEPCELPAQCTSGVCFEWGNRGYCTTTCSNTEPCEQGYHCAAGTCIRGDLGGDGAPCAMDANCKNGLSCVDFGGGFLHCATPCTPGTACETEGSICSTSLDGASFCKQAGGRGLGDDCSSSAPCIDGLTCQDAGSGDFRCFARCSRQDNTCAAFTACYEQGQVYCIPMDGGMGSSKGKDGGCSTSAGRGTNPAFGFLLLSALGLAVLRRRRRAA
jgi:MYXO-CTERM domain-containing protein